MKERLHLLNDGMMGKLILDARNNIRLLWDEMSTSPAQQRAFKHCTTRGIYTRVRISFGKDASCAQTHCQERRDYFGTDAV
mmetsp:Transcript_8066/g.11749  ORF Transcript_8066/g.11749 Transcript_8066/m.11749 type:complete len:81 (+) Transcript_8066:353-595(+)